MARQARKRSSTGVYHIMIRGINRQDIFRDEDDYKRFIDTIEKVKSDKFDIYGYCLMSNHVHLLLHEKNEKIDQIMKRIGCSYAWWYNKKYDRIGPVFQGRYKSECVEDDAYLLTVIRYIHKNPVKAGIVSDAENYLWSSIHEYYNESTEYLIRVINTDFILGIIAEERYGSMERFREFMKMEIEEKCLEDEIKNRITDEELKIVIESLLNGNTVPSLQIMEKGERNGLLRQIKSIEGVTQRQIARVTGLNKSIVFKA